MSKLIFAGGGTGGHLFPAIALAEEFKRRKPETEIIFLGTKKGLEKKMIPQKNFKLELISIKGLTRKLSPSLFTFPWFVLKSLIEANRILKKERADLIIGTGGYVSFPAVVAAKLRDLPILIQEQNSYPGISTRFLSFFAQTVCLTYESSRKFFLQKRKLRVLGNPVRKEIMEKDKNSALTFFNLEKNKKTLLIFGGSQGSHRINQVIKGCLDILEKRNDIQLLWQTGEKDFEEVKEFSQTRNLKIVVLPFIENMSFAYASCDLVISRAGALTLAEISLCGKPAILIPYPYAAADHQRANALEFEKKGAAVIILDKELTGERLSQTISLLLDDSNRLKQMSQTSKTLSHPEATAEIANEMEKLLAKGEN
jgi:UDP-N-acetylglucosamine--N-acetylmuramyl-(pentapeptide) pyrophosphoryl-undecaprenol N-acetylglucosamine transferase